MSMFEDAFTPPTKEELEKLDKIANKVNQELIDMGYTDDEIDEGEKLYNQKFYPSIPYAPIFSYFMKHEFGNLKDALNDYEVDLNNQFEKLKIKMYDRVKNAADIMIDSNKYSEKDTALAVRHLGKMNEDDLKELFKEILAD